jgi:hypothetical protein
MQYEARATSNVQATQTAQAQATVTATATATPTVALCEIRDEMNAVNVLAWTANSETDGGGPLSQDDTLAVGLMLMQINTYRANGQWRTLGTWGRAGYNLDGSNLPPLNNDRLNAIAELMVANFCQNNTDPLSGFANSSYPSIATNATLQAINNDIEARFEVSIAASRAQQFREDGAYRVRYVLEVPGAAIAVIIGGADVTNAWLGYQCPLGQEAVLRTDPDDMQPPFTAPDLDDAPDFTCQVGTVLEWWMGMPDDAAKRHQIETYIGRPIQGNYEVVTVVQFNYIRKNIYRGDGYVKAVRP